MTDTTQRSKPRLGRTYWTLNGVEMFERLAYFAIRAMVPVYIMQADDPGGLHLTAAHKGTIYAWWFVFQSVLPMFTGGFADRYGYKKTIAFAVTMNIAGYLMVASMRDYYGFFFGILVLATGTAFFKPALQGSLAQSMTKENSSVGWGTFYWVVNIGALAGPFLARAVTGAHSTVEWRQLFLMSAGFTALNYLMLFTFKDVPSGASKKENPIQVLRRTFKDIMEPRLAAWLLIMSAFWLMMYQVWDLHPNFITDWIDSSSMAGFLAHMPGGVEYWTVDTPRGPQVPQELLVSTNAAMIVLLMVPVSWLVRRMRTLSTMLIGMSMAVAGTLVAGLTGMGIMLVLGIMLFSLGEMLTGPKKNEYLALISPPDKKGQYLGYVNIPVGIGGFIGSKMAGFIYGNYGEKAVLALKYLATETTLGAGKNWDGDVATLEAAMGIQRTDAFVRLQEVTGLDATAATQLLWDFYSPQYTVWIPFAAIGVAASIALAIYGQMAKRWGNMNA